MERALAQELVAWLQDPDRKPLILRGARQVGKTWLARDLAARSGRELVEINFERNPERAQAFAAHDPQRVIDDLALALDRDIDPQRSLLFLDELQAAPEVFQSLRWFAEELAELPVLAAGSLIEFALARQEFSVPVGRVSYRHVEPLSFSEFLGAHGQERLLDQLAAWQPGEQLSAAAHERGIGLAERFGHVGGMPAVVAADVEHSDSARCRRLQVDLIATYRDDFAKYSGRMDPRVLDAVLLAVASQLGDKFVYARVGEGVKQQQAKNALELLADARVVTLVHHTHGTGVPLGGDANPRHRKVLLLDVGLAHALLGTPASPAFPAWDQLSPAVRGALGEQIGGQQLRSLRPTRGDAPSLHYWQRSGGRPGEIDFIVQVGHRIVPVELKSGAAGSMKSLHQFVHDRELDLAVRVDANPPSLQDVSVKTTQGHAVRYRLLNLPPYLLWRCAELIEGLG